MKIYVCHTTSGSDIHPCARAYRALIAAGYDPEVKVVRSTGRLPKLFNPLTKTRRRAEVELLTGRIQVPALELDDGSGIGGSQRIVEWALEHKNA